MLPPLLRVALLVAVLAPGACGSGDDGPTVETWRQDWERTVALVPSHAGLAAEEEERCGEALGELRAAREDLLPAPTEALDATATRWVDEAEGLLFECPGEGEELTERRGVLTDARAEVERLLGDAG